MAFFKFRKGEGDSVATPAQPESVEAMRKRARQRLIGAAILVLAGVIGFPLVFDTQPRPIAVDIPIDIPDRAKAAKLPSIPTTGAVGQVAGADAAPPAAVAAASAPAAAGIAPLAAPVAAPAMAPTAAASAKPAAAAAPAASVAPAAPAAVASASRPASAPVAKAAAAASAKPARAEADGERAKALLEGKAEGKPDTKAAAADGRFVVQVGAFAETGKASAARQKLEKAGLKTYTHVAETKDGKRIRVRVGPFATKAEADKAAAKVKGLDLPAAVLTL